MKPTDISQPDVSILVPVWNEEKVVSGFYSELSKVILSLNKKSEVIFIDDGSADNTFALLKIIYSQSANVKAVRLARNMGQHFALFVGMHYAQGRVVIGIDADLEYSPQEIPFFIEKIEEGYDLVFGWRQNYKQGLWRLIFIKCINYFVQPKVHDFTCPFRAMRETVVKQIRKCGSIDKISAKIPRERCSEIKIKFNPKKIKSSNYTIWRKLKLAFKMLQDIFLKRMNQNKKNDFSLVVSDVLS